MLQTCRGRRSLDPQILAMLLVAYRDGGNGLDDRNAARRGQRTRQAHEGRREERERIRRASANGSRSRSRSPLCGRNPRSTCGRSSIASGCRTGSAPRPTKIRLTMAGYRGQHAEIAFLFFRLVTPIGFFLGVELLPVRPRSPQAADDDPSRDRRRRDLRRVQGSRTVLVEPDIEAPELDPFRVARRSRSSPDLRRIRHVDRGRLPARERRSRLAIGAARRGVDADDGGTVLFAGSALRPTRNLSRRTGLEAREGGGDRAVQAERYGTPLGQALRVLAQESRDIRMNEAEKKAAALPPKLTVPMILFFLPVLFVVILTPAIIQVMNLK